MSGIRAFLFTSLFLCVSAAAASAQFADLEPILDEGESRKGEVLWDSKSGMVYAFYDLRAGNNWEIKVYTIDGKEEKTQTVVGFQPTRGDSWAVAQQERTGTMLLVYYRENTLLAQQLGKDGTPKGKPRKLFTSNQSGFFILGSFGRNEFLMAYFRGGSSADDQQAGTYLQRLSKKGKPKGDEVYLNNLIEGEFLQIPVAVKYGPDGPFIYLTESGSGAGDTTEIAVRVFALNDGLSKATELFSETATGKDFSFSNVPYFTRYNSAVGRHIISWDLDGNSGFSDLAVFDNDGEIIKPAQKLPEGTHPTDAMFDENSGLIATLFLWPSRSKASRFGIMNFSPRGQMVSTGLELPLGRTFLGESRQIPYAHLAPLPKKGTMFALVYIVDNALGVSRVIGYKLDPFAVVDF